MSDDRLDAGRHHLRNGHRALTLGYVEEGRVHFASALLQFRGPELRLGEAHARRGLAYAELADGESLAARDQILKAVEGYQELLELLTAIDDQGAVEELRTEALEGLAASTGFHGDLLLQVGKIDDARVVLHEARDLFDSLGDPPAAASVYRSLGRLALVQRHRSEAVALYDRALSAYRANDDWEGQIAALRLVADLRRSEGELAEAEAALDEARIICRKIDNTKLQGQILCALGGVLLQSLRYDGALDCFQRALNLAVETGDTVREGFALVGLGSLASVTTDLQPVPLLLEGAGLLVLMDHHHGVAGALVHLAFEARGARIPVVALAAAEGARRLYRRTDPVSGQGQALRQIVKALATLRQGRATLIATLLRQKIAGQLQPNANDVSEFFCKRAPADVVEELSALGPEELASLLEAQIDRILGPLNAYYNVPAAALGVPQSAVLFVARLIADQEDPQPQPVVAQIEIVEPLVSDDDAGYEIVEDPPAPARVNVGSLHGPRLLLPTEGVQPEPDLLPSDGRYDYDDAAGPPSTDDLYVDLYALDD